MIFGNLDLFWKDNDDDLFFFSFLKMNEAWSNAPSLQIDAWLFENLDIWEKDDFFFFKMDETWPNALSLMDAYFLRNLYILWKDDDDNFFKNE